MSVALSRARQALVDSARSLRDPTTQTDLIQLVKAATAAVLAWLAAVHLFDLAQPFLAPWTALLTVHATVYRSLSRGAQSVAATALGVGLSYAAAEVLGLGTATLAVALLAGLLLSRAGLLRDEGVTVATTALFVLTTGYEHQQELLLDRLLDVALGVAVGVLVNLVVLPPLADRSAQQQVDAINRDLGALMEDMAEELSSRWDEERAGAWIETTRDLDTRIDHAWQLVRHARESSWWNPRRIVSHHVGDPTSYERVLRRLEDGVAQLRAMARTIDESTRTSQEWDERFRGPWTELMTEIGRRIADPDGDVGSMRARVDDLTWELSNEELPGLLWPVYGALISSLRNLVDVVDDVATNRPVRT